MPDLDIQRHAAMTYQGLVAPERVTFDSLRENHIAAHVQNEHNGEDLGYWSITMDQLSGERITKVCSALRLMCCDQSMNCAFVEAPQLIARFDFRKRRFVSVDFKKMTDAEWQDKWKDWHDKRPSMQIGSMEDPDALIVPDEMYGAVRPSQDIDTDLEQLRRELAKFCYRGINIVVKRRNDPLMRHNCNMEEWRARGLLREMIGEEEFKRYMARGSITCKGDSGNLYVIYGGHTNIECFKRAPNGHYYWRESLCVQFKEQLAHTDSVIMRKLFVENDEKALRSMCNVLPVRRSDDAADADRVTRRRQQGITIEELTPDRLAMIRQAVPEEERIVLAASLSSAMAQTRKSDGQREF